MESTASEYEAAVADSEVAHQLAVYASEVLTNRLPKLEERAME